MYRFYVWHENEISAFERVEHFSARVRACCKDYIMVCRDVDGIDAESARAVFLQCQTGMLDLAFLLPWRPPPFFGFRIDGAVESYVCSAVLWARLEASTKVPECSDILHAAPVAAVRLRTRVFQLPNDLAAVPPQPPPPQAVDWVLSHHGPVNMLIDCLKTLPGVDGQNGAPRIRIGLDDEGVSDAEARCVEHEYSCALYRSSPPGCGPYAIRNALITISAAEYICFQDSDDFACTDREACLWRAVSEQSLGMAGSHELRWYPKRRMILAVRYPLQVNAALERGGQQCLLHPTSMVSKRLFCLAGGFSTTARFALDTQFTLRSYFFFRSANVDKFLYIRRHHDASLTNAPETNMRSLARMQLSKNWCHHFGLLLGGQMALGDSSLVKAGDGDGCNLVPISEDIS